MHWFHYAFMRLEEASMALALLLFLCLGLAPVAMEPSSEAVSCSTLPSRGGTVNPEPCVFPFEYDGRTFDACTPHNDPGGRLWCSVEVDASGRHVRGRARWGHCDPKTCVGVGEEDEKDVAIEKPSPICLTVS